MTTKIVFMDSPQQESKKAPQFIAALIATIGCIIVGTFFTWTSAALTFLDSKNLITPNEASWIGSLLSLGAFAGAAPTGVLANWIGRKKTLLLLNVPTFLSWLAMALYPENVSIICVARFIGGACVGGISVAAPMYVAELAEISIKGTLGTLFQVQITVGLLIGYILGYVVEDFQILTLACSSLPVVFLVSFVFMPESPVFLCSKGMTSEAKKSLQWFRGRHYDVEPELSKMSQDIREAEENKANFSDIFKCKATRKGLLIALGLMTCQQLSGVNAVLFYTSEIFKKSGSNLSPQLSSIVVEITQVLATLASTALIDRAGRKILLVVSESVMCGCLAALGTYSYLNDHGHDMDAYNLLPMASLSLFIIFFSIGVGPIPWMIVGDIFSPNLKGTASSLTAALSWILSFTVTNQFPNMVESVGSGVTFFMFCAICAFGTFFILTVVPETKGKCVDEVMVMLHGRRESVVRREEQKDTTYV